MAWDEEELRLTPAGVQRLFAEHEGVIELGSLEAWHVGLRIDAEELDDLRVQGRDTTGRWSEAQPLEISWQEGPAHVAHAFFDAPVDALRLIPGRARIAFALIEFFDTPPPAAEPGSGELGDPSAEPGEGPEFGAPEGGFDADPAWEGVPEVDGPLGSPKSSHIPPGGVARPDWGAVAPACTPAAHTIRRLTVHHTATPNQDSIDAPARMRQMQSYHMGPNLRWCDLGYHYVIGFDGRLYQGRSTPDRLGTHVGSHNSENLGLSLMGDFRFEAPRASMIEELKHALCWSAQRYASTLPRNRTAIRGHNEWSGHASNSCPGTLLRNQLDGLVAGICAPTCTDACSGGARCVSETERETCADHNGDGCNDWGGRAACGAGERCEGAGGCVVIPEPSEPSVPGEPSTPQPSEPAQSSEPNTPDGSAAASGEDASSAAERESAEAAPPSDEAETSQGGDAAAPTESAAAGQSGAAGADVRAPGERRGDPGEQGGDAPEVVTTSGCSAAAGGPLGAGPAGGAGALWGLCLVLLVAGRRRVALGR